MPQVPAFHEHQPKELTFRGDSFSIGDDTFKQCLRWNLQTLEDELLKAHQEVLQSSGARSGNRGHKQQDGHKQVLVAIAEDAAKGNRYSNGEPDAEEGSENSQHGTVSTEEPAASAKRPYQCLRKRPMEEQSHEEPLCTMHTVLDDAEAIKELEDSSVAKEREVCDNSCPNGGLTVQIEDEKLLADCPHKREGSLVSGRGSLVSGRGSLVSDLARGSLVSGRGSIRPSAVSARGAGSVRFHERGQTCDGFPSEDIDEDGEQQRESMYSSVEEHQRNSTTKDRSSTTENPGLVLRSTWQYAHSANQGGRARKSKFVQKLSQSLGHQQSKKQRSSAFSIATEQGERFALVIHPFSKAWVNWEIFGFTLLVYDFIFVPMQAFEMEETLVLSILKWSTTVYWTLTFFLTFLVSFQRSSDSTFIVDHKEIVIHYLKGWFALDCFLVSSDWISFAIESIVDSEGLNNARIARMARLSRVFRFVRLLRVMRIGEMLQRVKSLINSEYVSICFLLACNVITILVLAHLAACVWFMIGNASDKENWLVPMNLQNASVGLQYLESLSWSLSTLLGTTVTYAFPQSTTEHTCALIILVMGTIAVSLVFSSTTAAMTRLQQLRSDERDSAFKLKQFLRQNNISSSLEARVVRYVDIAKSVHSKRIPSGQVVLLNLLSGPLRLELQLELHAPHLSHHHFFELYHQTSPGAMSELCLTAVGFIYLCRYDSLFQSFSQASSMYFLTGGVMAYRRAKGARGTPQTVKIDKGMYVCEANLWTCWVHRGGMRAIIESQVLALDALAFCEITETHHDVYLQAADYAANYVQEINQELHDDNYVWDVPSELMYPGRHRKTEDGRESAILKRGSQFEPSHVSLLKEAEQVSAELMNLQGDSDSDSEDERMFKMALSRNPSFYGRSSNASNPRGISRFVA